MARINKQEVLQEMQEGLRLDTAREKTPQELADKILPTYTVNPRPRIIKVFDTSANDSDKLFTVPTGKRWKFLYGFVLLVTTATVGNRRIRIRLLDDVSDTYYDINALNVQTASSTELYSLGNFGNVSEDVATFHLLPLPINLILPENHAMQIHDSAGVAVTADDMSVRMMFEEEDMPPNR